MKSFMLSTWDTDGKRRLWGAFPNLERLTKYMLEYQLLHVEIKEWECIPENESAALAYYGLDVPDVVGPIINSLFVAEDSNK